MTEKKRLFGFFAITVLFSMAASFAHPVTPTIFKELNLGSYMFGVALAAMMSVNFLFSPFWGKINGYISSRKSLLISCVGYGVGQLMFGLAQTEGAFIFARMFAGIFTGGTFVSMLTYVVNTAEDSTARGTNLTIYATIQAVGGAFGYFVGGMIGEVSVYAAVLAQVVTLSICGVLFFVVCKDDRAIGVGKIKPLQLIKEANPFSAFMESRKFLTGVLMILFAMCALQNLGNTAFDQTFNYYIKDAFNFSSGYNGIIKGAMGLITLVANSTICIWMVRKTNTKKSIIGVLALCCLSTLGGVLSGTVVPFIAFNILFFAVNGISMPILQDLVAQKANGGDSNLIMGFYNAMKSLGGIVGALFAGVLYSVGQRLPFIFGMAAFAIATLLALLYFKKDKDKTVV